MLPQEKPVSERALEHREALQRLEVVARVAVCAKGGDCAKSSCRGCSAASYCVRRRAKEHTYG